MSYRTIAHVVLLASIASVAMARTAQAQTPCGGSLGPDVIAGAVTTPANYAHANGVDAISLGSTICNLGSAEVAYSAGTNQHPLTAQNLYRWSIVDGASRFEQVGMSWLVEGFFALQGTTCCADCQPGDGAHLGVHCSSPDTASANGVQSNLAPRWQVNAFTGAFPYPPANPPFSGSVARRLQAHVADLAPTGGTRAPRYFGEVQFIAPDDALAGNGINNASYRELSVAVNAGEWSFAIAPGAPTVAQSAAIRAWRDIDPAVVETDVQVPGEGLFVLAEEVTDLGAGTWRYELALYNMNSDRSARTLSIPIANGVHVSNIGFHDVDYHDGDGPGSVDFDGSDWPGTLAGGSLTFATDEFASNASANALRFGTTYNFRFDANVAPGEGSVTVGLWNTGSPGQVSAAAEIPSGVPTQSSFCFGDGSGALCPCFNFGLAGRGCDNSAATGGASLVGTGTPSLSVDTVLFTTGGELPTALTIFAQGQQTITPVNFGDGLRCVGVNLKRLFTKSAVAGIAVAPQPGDPSVSSRSATLGDPIPSGAARYYYAYYRDPSASFCPAPSGDTFNSTSSVGIMWAP